MSGTAIVRSAAVESWEDHVEAWHHLGRQVDGANWGRAAVAASLRDHFGADALRTFAGEVGYHPGSVYRFARIFDAFPSELQRCNDLTFSHHLIAVELTDTAEEARAAVGLAEREGLKAQALRRRLLAQPADQGGGDGAAASEAATESGEVCTEPGSCGPITDSDRVLHIWAFVENFYAVKDYDAKALIEQSTKKSAKEMLRKIDQIQKWFATMQKAIRERVG